MIFALPKAGRYLAEKAAGLGLTSKTASPFAKWRVPLHEPGFPLVLLYSEKAGCTTLTKWFLFQTGKLDEAIRFHPWVHQYRTTVLIRQKGYTAEAVRLVHSGKKPVIKVVRDPYERAVSSFLHVLKIAPKRDHSHWERELVATARAQAGKIDNVVPVLSFRDFLRFLASNGTALGQINTHIAQQYIPGEDGRISRIIKLERFAEEIRRIESEFGLAQSPLERIAESRHHNSASQRQRLAARGCAADLEITSEQIRKRRLPPYDSLYDEETRGLVRDCFAVDFKAYGYEP